MEESQRQEREIAAQIERAKQVEAARDRSGDAAAADGQFSHATSQARCPIDGPVKLTLGAASNGAVREDSNRQQGKRGAGASMFDDAPVDALKAMVPGPEAHKRSMVRLLAVV